MKIVMLEPLGVSREFMEPRVQPLLDAGHEFVYCDSKLTVDEKKSAIRDAEILIIANGPLTEEILLCAEKLRMISVGFTGIDHVALDTCREKGITVCNAQGYATDSTAELAIGLMLACLRNIVPYDSVVRSGGTLAGYTHNTLRGKTVGIVGTGAIGTRTGELAKAFGCRVLGFNRSEKEAAIRAGIEYCDLETLFRESDIVSLHIPYTADTEHLVNSELIGKMKETAILINCARGPVVDSEALAKALNDGRIAAAGIDVFETEPPIPQDHPLLHAKNAILTPHVGFYSEESLAERFDIVLDNVKAWLDGAPINVKLL
ncbi:MAG: NAD(P)-binding domain-containing protein [Clostridiales bacterium]|nr:NAD(P)-binding domain-containing protein [Clostridiales bacterium]MDD7035982.1 NAD(P)-dependent oxidoreductase [Bacillota bacterium]MDY2920874.1 NAD(P)-dependent oxidoreductase [Lentihominibacter sp.]